MSDLKKMTHLIWQDSTATWLQYAQDIDKAPTIYVWKHWLHYGPQTSVMRFLVLYNQVTESVCAVK